jgi:hypothetical protein
LSAFALGEILASFANSPISYQIRFKNPLMLELSSLSRVKGGRRLGEKAETEKGGYKGGFGSNLVRVSNLLTGCSFKAYSVKTQVRA